MWGKVTGDVKRVANEEVRESKCSISEDKQT